MISQRKPILAWGEDMILEGSSWEIVRNARRIFMRERCCYFIKRNNKTKALQDKRSRGTMKTILKKGAIL